MIKWIENKKIKGNNFLDNQAYAYMKVAYAH